MSARPMTRKVTRSRRLREGPTTGPYRPRLFQIRVWVATKQGRRPHLQLNRRKGSLHYRGKELRRAWNRFPVVWLKGKRSKLLLCPTVTDPQSAVVRRNSRKVVRRTLFPLLRPRDRRAALRRLPSKERSTGRKPRPIYKVRLFTLPPLYPRICNPWNQGKRLGLWNGRSPLNRREQQRVMLMEPARRGARCLLHETNRLT